MRAEISTYRVCKLDETRKQQNSPPEIQKADRSLNALVKDGKIYLPASFLSNEFGYASDHIARLARQNKVQAICQDKKWYVVKDSLLEYQKQAIQNKVNGGLKSTSVLSKTEPVSKKEVQKKFAFDNTLKNFSNHLNTFGEYLSKARTKTAERAILISAVFLIFIFSGTFILVGASVSKSLSEKIISSISPKSSDNLQMAGIFGWFGGIRNLIPSFSQSPSSQEIKSTPTPESIRTPQTKPQNKVFDQNTLNNPPIQKETAYLPANFIQDSLNELSEKVKVQ